MPDHWHLQDCLSRFLAVAIGLIGVLLVGLIVAIAVSALERVSERYRSPR